MKLLKLFSRLLGSRENSVDALMDQIKSEAIYVGPSPTPGSDKSLWKPLTAEVLLWGVVGREFMIADSMRVEDGVTDYDFFICEEARFTDDEVKLIVRGKNNRTNDDTGWLEEGEYFTWVGM